jgi:hypothetical protein
MNKASDTNGYQVLAMKHSGNLKRGNPHGERTGEAVLAMSDMQCYHNI